MPTRGGEDFQFGFELFPLQGSGAPVNTIAPGFHFSRLPLVAPPPPPIVFIQAPAEPEPERVSFGHFVHLFARIFIVQTE